MKLRKIFSLCIVLIMLFSCCACAAVDNDYNVTSNDSELISSYNELPKVVSLDKKMANYFDISLFDEENYANIYLGKKFKYDITFADSKLAVPTTIGELLESGWEVAKPSDYDSDSYIYAKETVNLNFKKGNATITALFYNSSNTSIRLKKCKIVKIRFENSENNRFVVNGINNDSSVIDVINALGTPSHFYAVTEENYYFDYFLQKSDRRNKIRVFVDLTDDTVTAIEFSNYK